MITEVLITALLIVITMVGILPLLFAGVKTIKVSKSKAIATTIVQKEIESFNQKKFLGVLEDIKKNHPNFDNFSNQTSPVVEPSPQTLYINVVSGAISNNIGPGFKTSTLTKTYSFIFGQLEDGKDKTMTDDVIQLDVELLINGEKPVRMSSSIGRDKLQ